MDSFRTTLVCFGLGLITLDRFHGDKGLPNRPFLIMLVEPQIFVKTVFQKSANKSIFSVLDLLVIFLVWGPFHKTTEYSLDLNPQQTPN